MLEVFVDALIDSLKVLAAVLVCTYLIAVLEPVISKKVKLNGKLAPLLGVSLSLLPQCGFSVVATDLYQKRHLTVGALIGVFLATSDEALPIFLSYPEKALHILPILGFKFAIGLLFGYAIDIILVKSRKSVEHHLSHCNDEYRIKLMHTNGAELVNCDLEKKSCNCEECENSSCPSHPHELHEKHNHKQKEESGILFEYSKKYTQKKDKKEKLNRFLVSPLLHSLEIFAYVLVVNIIFSIIFYFVGEDKIVSFLLSNKYLAPLFSVIVGLIPNCVSSIVISELYIIGGLGFGATLGGLCMNAGVAFIYLLKDRKNVKKNLLIIGTVFLISVSISYIFSFAFSFGPLF